MATLFSCVSEELGYGECRVDSEPVWWGTGFTKALLAAAASTVVIAARWYHWSSVLWLPPLVGKGLLSMVAAWWYLRWLNPLEYESVAIKRTRGVELCTKWRRLEWAVVVPFKDLTAVTLQEVSDRNLMLTFEARGGTVHMAYRQTEPSFQDLLCIYESLHPLLPRHTKRRPILSLMRDPSRPLSATRWLQREAHFLRCGCAALRAASEAAAQRARIWGLRRFYALRQSERFEAAWGGWLGRACGCAAQAGGATAAAGAAAGAALAAALRATWAAAVGGSGSRRRGGVGASSSSSGERGAAAPGGSGGGGGGGRRSKGGGKGKRR